MNLIDFPQEPVIGMQFDKRLEKEDILTLEKIVDEKLKTFPKLGVYIEMEDFKGISFEALIEDIKAFIPKITSFKKKAVVAPESTLMNVGQLIAKIIPNIEFKHFLPEDKEKAKTWVAEMDEPLSHISSVDY